MYKYQIRTTYNLKEGQENQDAGKRNESTLHVKVYFVFLMSL